MRIAIDVTMAYQLNGEEPALLTIEAARTDGQTIVESQLDIENATLSRVSGEGGLGQRVWAHVQSQRLNLRYRAQVDVTRPAIPLQNLKATPLHALSGEVATYLRASRYCEADLFGNIVAKQFGDLEGGAKIAAMRDWVNAEIAYVPGSSGAATGAIDTFISREGVCRDFAHLMCSLARAAGIPARYTSVYGLGVTPPDFHAVAQVWLADAWHLVDATGMSTADGLVVIAAGRDAGDVAFLETTQWAQLANQTVDVSRG